jgi:hypothetical protein
MQFTNCSSTLRRLSQAGVSAALIMLVGACGTDSGSPTTAGSGTPTSGSPSTGFGQMTLRITDAPVDDATAVVVEFTGVEIKAANEDRPEVFDFDAPRQIDLLALDGGGSETILEDEVLPAGSYEWIRLKVNAGRDASDSYVTDANGGKNPLFIPSGNETGLKLVDGFSVPAGGEADFTIDFNLRKSVLKPPGLAGLYLLKPALQLIDNNDAGSIEGTVAASIAAENCEPVVYVYQGLDVVPDDEYEDGDSSPYRSTAVKLDETSGQYRYNASPLPSGDYTVALTCEAGNDDPEEDDDIAFIDPQNATVVAGEATIVDFPKASTGGGDPGASEGLTVRFTFEASGFSGPTGSQPLERVRGSFTLQYETDDLAGATVTEFEIRGVNALVGYENWGTGFNASNVLVELSEDDVLLGGLPPIASASGNSEDFAVRIALDAPNPAMSGATFQSLVYTVANQPDVRQTTSGTATLSVVD